MSYGPEVIVIGGKEVDLETLKAILQRNARAQVRNLRRNFSVPVFFFSFVFFSFFNPFSNSHGPPGHKRS